MPSSVKIVELGETLTCKRCKQDKPLSEYQPYNLRLAALNRWWQCRDCSKRSVAASSGAKGRRGAGLLLAALADTASLVETVKELESEKEDLEKRLLVVTATLEALYRFRDA